jgi:hypothetical protein
MVGSIDSMAQRLNLHQPVPYNTFYYGKAQALVAPYTARC